MKTIKKLMSIQTNPNGDLSHRVRAIHELDTLKDVIKLIEPFRVKLIKELTDWACKGIPINYGDIVNKLIEEELKERIGG